MKRVILTSAATVAGVAALLSFKTQPQPLTPAALPSAGTGSGQTSSSPSPSASATRAAARTRSYTGRAVTTRYGIVQVKVTVHSSKITDVAFTQLTAFDGHSAEINSWAGPQLLQETIHNQSAQVDTVSGASYTSEGYRTSLQSALDQAGIS